MALPFSKAMKSHAIIVFSNGHLANHFNWLIRSLEPWLQFVCHLMFRKTDEMLELLLGLGG